VKTAKLYHAIRPTFGMGPRPAFPSGYRHVADVLVDADGGGVQKALEELWAMTQHLDAPWPRPVDGHLITLYVDTHTLRSTSMGDIVELGGRFYEAVSLGWKNITDEIRRGRTASLGPRDREGRP
jgi:hypothetical protein